MNFSTNIIILIRIHGAETLTELESEVKMTSL